MQEMVSGGEGHRWPRRESRARLIRWGVGIAIFAAMLGSMFTGRPASADQGGFGTLPTVTSTNTITPTETATATATATGTATATATSVPPTSVPSNPIYLPVISSADSRLWRKLAANGQQLNSVTFKSIPNQAVELYVGDGRPNAQGGGIYRGGLLPSCSGTVSLTRVFADAWIVDVYFDNDRGVAGTFGGKAYYYNFANDSWKQTTSDAIDKNVYSLTSADRTFFAGTDNGVFQSVDGVSWFNLGGPGLVNVVQAAGDSLWVGTNSTGVYQMLLSTGSFQVPNNNGLADAASLKIWDIVVLGETLYIGTSNGVFQRTAAGSWIAGGLQGKRVYTLEIVGSELFAGLHEGGVYLRGLSGGEWTPLVNGAGWNRSASVQDLVYRSDLCTTGALFAASDNGLWLLTKP